MLSHSLLALAGASSALALSYHGSPNPALHKRNLGAVELAGQGADHLKRDFFGNAEGVKAKRMARKVNKGLNRRASTLYSTTANYYATTGGYSACHTYFSDDDMVIALPTGLYPDVGAVSEYCGKTVLATNPATGVSQTLTVQDASWAADYVTLPKGAFLALGGSTDAGELAITFEFTDASVSAPSSTSAADVTVSTAARANKAESKKSSSSAPAAEPSTTQAQAETTSNVEVKVAQTNAAARVAATTTAAPTTTPAPAPTSDSYDYASASKASADAAWASSSKAEADAAWASSSKAAAASADAAWASSSSAAAAAASKSSADAAWAASSSSSAAAAQETKSNDSGASSGGGGGDVHSGGFATYFLQNGVAGNCGTVAQESDKVIALPTNTYANGAHCGAQIRITRPDTGAQVVATVRDSCPTCINDNCLDLSEGAFGAIAKFEEGQVAITWEFI